MGPRILVAIAGIYGAVGVGLGAFGAHALKDRLPPDRLGHLDTAVRYLFTSIPGLLVTGVLVMECSGGVFAAIAAWSFVVGALVFAGSLVALALTGVRRWGAVTPVGGVLLVVGWLAVAGAALMLPGSGDVALLRLAGGC
ncbi:MAG TPA: DUF423 domain-containing protein [Actinomycetota bacterium]